LHHFLRCIALYYSLDFKSAVNKSLEINRMSLTVSDIKKIAHLARIEISPSEAEATLKKLTGIMDLIAEMQAVDTSGVIPMSHSQDVTQRLRDDVVTQQNQRELFQSIAPAVQDGLYLVPKVIE
jgi:aspartyl-tRNA(Asn)/glutamyl-tRNA(Gln) amidotransferase subunit C